jgi:hypothetical protein
MFIEFFQSNLYHVGLVDVIHHGTNVYERSFASSAQLIEWLKTHFQNTKVDPTPLIAVRRGGLGEVLPSMPDYRSVYSPSNGDIEIGRKFVYDQSGFRYRELSVGAG